MSEPLTSDINVDTSSASISLDHDQSITSMSTWSRGPGSDRWDILLDEAERFRLYLSKKKANNKYGGFHDEELSFSDDNLNFTLPKSLSGIDRESICLQSTSRDAEEGEPCPIFHARFYRDSCTELEQHCRQLKNEKEGVRYFWQNKVTVLESQSRGDKILMIAKQSSTSTSVV